LLLYMYILTVFIQHLLLYMYILTVFIQDIK